jgi:cell division initiation protein
MDLSPNDIRSYEFRNQMRGYDKDEVDNLLDQVASALEETKQQNLKLSMELESLRAQLSGLKQFEDTIKSAAIDARRNADMTVATAKQEAEMILNKARQQAEDLLAKRAKDISEIEAKITRLGLTKKSYLSKIRSMVQSHLDMIDEVDSGEVQSDELSDTDDKIAVTESTDIKTGKRETVAQQPPEPPEDEAEEEEAAADTADSETAEEAAEDLAADLKDAIHEESTDQPAEQAIDPELAAALESYKKMTAQKAAAEKPRPETPPPPPQGVIVETTSRAEDIPDGFIARESDLEGERSTDKVRMGQGDGPMSMEPNSLGGFRSPGDPKAPLPPEKLAEELDEVAAKFAKN